MTVTASSQQDDGKKVLFQGVDINNVEVTETVVINSKTWNSTQTMWLKLTEINKDITVGQVGLWIVALPPTNPIAGNGNGSVQPVTAMSMPVPRDAPAPAPRPGPPPPPPGGLHAPSINPPAGGYPSPLDIRIMAADRLQGLSIMYTTDGSDPTVTNGISGGWDVFLRQTPLPVTVKAIEVRSGVAGPMTVREYTNINTQPLNPPVIHPACGQAYPFPFIVEILVSDRRQDISLVYTDDGSDPTTSPNAHQITAWIFHKTYGSMPSGQTQLVINAVEKDGAGNFSPIATCNFFDVGAPPPPPGGNLPPPAPTPTSTLLATYYAGETNPRYRMLRLSQVGFTARFLFRRKVFQILSMDDFIPVQSQLGMLTMVQAIQALRRKDFETAKASADAAVEITTDAQRATTGFIELANNTEVQAARNYQIYNRDSVIMIDVFDDIAKILGNVGQFKIFDATTVALEALCNKGHYDGFTGYVDIQTDGWRYATLPRFVDQPVAISINGRPAYMRNKWAEFHLNGPGSDEYGGQHMGGARFGSWYGHGTSGRWGQIHAWDSVGTVCTIKPLSNVSQLVAIPDDPTDDGKTYRIYGYDERGKRIRQNGQDGYIVVVDHTKIVPFRNTDQRIARIDRITRDATKGFVRLYAFDQAQQVTSVLLGYHYPDETEPQYFRIRLPLDAHWIRLRYRKRTLKVTSVWQPLHLFSRLSIVTMVRALKTLETDAAGAQVMEDKAMKYLDEDQKARNPGETFQLQIDEDCGWNSNFIVS
ncbi:MAG: hypothetical protein C5B54_06340 [Acidobacteria bacterium]|nr:MAG: hypothetical protein C5B54_06340 [Acidobacteriota bacterium]